MAPSPRATPASPRGSLGNPIVRVVVGGPFWLSLDTEAEPGLLFDMYYTLELGMLLSGRMRLHYSRWQKDLLPGDVWFTGVWERHGRSPIDGEAARVIIRMVPTALMGVQLRSNPPVDWALPFRTPPQCRPVTAEATRAQVLAIGRRLTEIARDDQDPDGEAWIPVLLLELLLALRRGWRRPAEVETLLEVDYPAMNAAVDLVLSSRSLLRSQDPARTIGLSRNIFARRFKEFTGVSFPEFCLRHRLSRAAAQLLETPETLDCVAHTWGFTHATHMSRLFLRYYRRSAAQYRRWGAGAPLPEAHAPRRTAHARSRGRRRRLPGDRGRRIAPRHQRGVRFSACASAHRPGRRRLGSAGLIERWVPLPARKPAPAPPALLVHARPPPSGIRSGHAWIRAVYLAEAGV